MPSTSRGLEQCNDPRPAEVEDRVELPANDRSVFYRTKQIRPIFVDEPAEIIVVTVYVYYFSGERR